MKRQKLLFFLTSSVQTVLIVLLLWDSIQQGITFSIIAAAAALLTVCGANFFLFRIILTDVDGMYLKDAMILAEHHRKREQMRKEQISQEEEQEKKIRMELMNQIGQMEKYVKQKKTQTVSGKENFTEISERLDEMLQQTRREVWCDNTLLNVLIHDKKKMAERAGVYFDAVLNIQEESGMHPLALCSVFSNLLDNAIEAAAETESGGRTVTLRAAMFSKTMVIKVRNPYSREEQRSHQGRKHDGANHGIGLNIVKKIAERYHGGVSIEKQGDIFQIIVYLDCDAERMDQK